MPIIESTVAPARQRILELLRANPGREYVASEIAKSVGCDVSIVTGHCRALAEEHRDVWYVVPPVSGVAARIYSGRRANLP